MMSGVHGVTEQTCSETEDSGAIQKAEEFIRAFMLGFEVGVCIHGGVFFYLRFGKGNSIVSEYADRMGIFLFASFFSFFSMVPGMCKCGSGTYGYFSDGRFSWSPCFCCRCIGCVGVVEIG